MVLRNWGGKLVNMLGTADDNVSHNPSPVRSWEVVYEPITVNVKTSSFHEVSLTVLVLALHWFGGKGWFALSHLVDSRDSELMA